MLGAFLGQITSVAEVAKTAGEIRDKNVDTVDSLSGLYNKTLHTRFHYTMDNETIKKLFSNPIGNEDLADGNPCMADEEPLGGLCYKKCSLLTNGEKPVRTSAFSCCEEEPCHWFNTMFRFSMCSALDVAGEGGGGGCPHAYGKCLETEEMHAGSCYGQCKLLTWGKYPFRTGASTCCQMMSKVSCMDARISHTSPLYNVGGRMGNNLLPTFLQHPHKPLVELTELPAMDESEEAVLSTEGGPMSLAHYVKATRDVEGGAGAVAFNHSAFLAKLARLKSHGESITKPIEHKGKIVVVEDGMKLSKAAGYKEASPDEALEVEEFGNQTDGLNRTRYVTNAGDKEEDEDDDEDDDEAEREAEREAAAEAEREAAEEAAAEEDEEERRRRRRLAWLWELR